MAYIKNAELDILVEVEDLLWKLSESEVNEFLENASEEVRERWEEDADFVPEELTIYKLKCKVWNMNERLLTKRMEDRKTVREYYREKRKIDKNYGRGKARKEKRE